MSNSISIMQTLISEKFGKMLLAVIFLKTYSRILIYAKNNFREMAMNLDMTLSMGATMGAGTLEGLGDGMMEASMGVEPNRIVFTKSSIRPSSL